MKNEKRNLNRHVLYCRKYFKNLKTKMLNLRSRKIKKKYVVSFLSSKFENTLRAPNKSLSLQVAQRVDRKAKNYNNLAIRNNRQTLRKKVEQFFERDENSVAAPGSREFVTKKKIRK